jgi:signal transduction histidine kinase
VNDKPNESRNAFGAITSVAHELRTPLTAIQGAVEILGDEAAGALNPAQREFVNLAHRNLARLKDRIEDALDISALLEGSAPRSAIVRLDEIAACVAKRSAVELGAEAEVQFRGCSGEIALPMHDRTLCRILTSIVGTVGRHAATGDVLVQAAASDDQIRFEASAGPQREGAPEDAVIHDASLALASEVVAAYGGSLTRLGSGRCGVYVFLPLRPI